MTATLQAPDAVSVGELRTLALAGGTAPPWLGGRYRRIVSGSVDDSGGVALSVELAESAASGAVLLRDAAGGWQAVALAGGEAPGGGRYLRFRELDLADGGWLLFRAELDGRAGAQGLFLRGADGAVRCVARAGEAAAGSEYASFAQPTLVSSAAGPSLAFVARLADGRECVLQHPAYQPPSVSLCTGTRLGTESGTDEVVQGELVISRLGMALCCVARLRTGQRRYTSALVVTPSVVSSGEWLRTGAELPGHGRIARLLTPPAVCAQLGFATIGLDGGRMALCSRPPVLDDPAVLLSSGDAVPGLPGETVHRIGPPVASSSAALQLPFGVACPVRLRGEAGQDRPALWLGVFAGQAPLDGAAIVPWLDGEPATDHPSLGINRLSPVKLGNDGTLLLRAVVGGRTERRTSLLVLPGLFDWFAAGRG